MKHHYECVIRFLYALAYSHKGWGGAPLYELTRHLYISQNHILLFNLTNGDQLLNICELRN